MSDLGKARPASHQNLTEKFGGLLTRVEAPEPSVAPVPATADVAPVLASPAAPEPSLLSVESPVTDTLTVDATKAKKAPRRKTAEPQQQQEAATPAPLATPAPAPREPENMPEVTHETAAEGKADQPVQISLPSSIEARLAKFKAESGLSHPNILFDAIEATAERLPELVKAKTIQLGSAASVSLFNRPQTAVKRDIANEPKKTFIIRITKQNKAVLDDLVNQVEAPNRNVLIVTAYDTYLPTE